MIQEGFSASKRNEKVVTLATSLTVVGGGLAGVCAAVTAARQGVKVVLVQDRPVLGGNASSEVRLWILGATSHMGNNNRWAREGGLIDEILIENLYRNRESNSLIFDTILLEKVKTEENITLLLNTAMYDLEKASDNRIAAVKAFCSQNSTHYVIKSPFFCDASGDGILAFQAGAAFRMGAESMNEFGEKFAPDVEDYGELLGHSMYFFSKRAGAPVKYVPPAYALKDITQIPRHKSLSSTDMGPRLWWLEYGGRTDTIHETENIKWELWKVIYGVWDHIKNSGEFEDVDDLTLEWVATIPGKRESRRFEGHYMLTQQDVIEQRRHDDAVAFGGWSVDLHPSDGIYSDKPGCNQWHSKGIYGIPYRCYVARDIENLWLAGRIISASHVAFGSSRVMATCAHGGQAVGMAAALCFEEQKEPAQLTEPLLMKELQQRLSIEGQGIPDIAIDGKGNLASSANITPSSTYTLKELPFDGDWLPLSQGTGQLLPVRAGAVLKSKIQVKAKEATTLRVELKTCSRLGSHTPDVLIETLDITTEAGTQFVELPFAATLDKDQYAFLLFRSNEAISLRTSEIRLTGVLSVFNKVNKAVSNSGKQEPDADIGVDTFEFWTPERRPAGKNIAMAFDQSLQLFDADHLTNGFLRPILRTNAWAAEQGDLSPSVTMTWDTPQTINEIRLFWDNDYDHPLESSLMEHPEDVMPFCVRNYKIFNDNGELIFEMKGNHQTINKVEFSDPIETTCLRLELEQPVNNVPAALFEIFIR